MREAWACVARASCLWATRRVSRLWRRQPASQPWRVTRRELSPRAFRGPGRVGSSDASYRGLCALDGHISPCPSHRSHVSSLRSPVPSHAGHFLQIDLSACRNSTAEPTERVQPCPPQNVQPERRCRNTRPSSSPPPSISSMRASVAALWSDLVALKPFVSPMRALMFVIPPRLAATELSRPIKIAYR